MMEKNKRKSRHLAEKSKSQEILYGGDIYLNITHQCTYIIHVIRGTFYRLFNLLHILRTRS